MPKFIVTIPYVTYLPYTVEAANVAEAILLADEGESEVCRPGDVYDEGEVLMDRPRHVFDGKTGNEAWYTPDGTFLKNYDSSDFENAPKLPREED